MNIDLDKKLKIPKNKIIYELGLSDGREKRALEIALRLKREDVPSDIIFRATGINLDTITK